MKKLFLLFSIIIYCHGTVTAQNLSIEETKTILCSHTWVLKRLEQDNKIIAVSKGLQGLKMVFKTDGNAYQVLPSEVESEKAKDPFKWSITRTTLTIDLAAGNRRVSIYTLKDVAGMKLYITHDEVGEPAFVYEPVENSKEISDDSYYSSYPEMDSMFKALAITINQKSAGNGNLITGSWGLKQISFKSLATKPDASREAYIAVFKKALYAVKEAGEKLTKEDTADIDFGAEMFALSYFGSTVDFKENNKLSYQTDMGSVFGKYTLEADTLKMYWDKAGADEFEIVKSSSTDLILKDKKLQITFYYKRSE